METYRIINRELSLNNQELRNALNKLKHEVTYLNRQLFEQREQFSILKESLASTIEKKCNEIMNLIYPDRISQTKSPTHLDIISHRRSCSNVTAAEHMKSRTFSPPVRSSAKDLLVDVNLKTPVPKIVVERDARISKSPGRCPAVVANKTHSQNSSDMQISAEWCEDKNSAEAIEEEKNSAEDLEENHSLVSGSNTLLTINEESSTGVETINETLTDATLNNLLDAPCSTPYHPSRISNETTPTLESKQMRVLVRKLSLERISQLMMNSIRSNSSQSKALECITMERNTSFRGQIKRESSIKTLTEPMKSAPKKKAKENPTKASRSRSKQGAFKENCSESENTCSENESNVSNINLRQRKKKVSLKEPGLRQKLRNTTNLKL